MADDVAEVSGQTLNILIGTGWCVATEGVWDQGTWDCDYWNGDTEAELAAGFGLAVSVGVVKVNLSANIAITGLSLSVNTNTRTHFSLWEPVDNPIREGWIPTTV